MPLVFPFVLKTFPECLTSPLSEGLLRSPVCLVPSQGELGEIGLDGLDGEDVSDLTLRVLTAFGPEGPRHWFAACGGNGARNDILSLSLAGRQRVAWFFWGERQSREKGTCTSLFL